MEGRFQIGALAVEAANVSDGSGCNLAIRVSNPTSTHLTASLVATAFDATGGAIATLERIVPVGSEHASGEYKVVGTEPRFQRLAPSLSQALEAWPGIDSCAAIARWEFDPGRSRVWASEPCPCDLVLDGVSVETRGVEVSSERGCAVRVAIRNTLRVAVVGRLELRVYTREWHPIGSAVLVVGSRQEPLAPATSSTDWVAIVGPSGSAPQSCGPSAWVELDLSASEIRAVTAGS